MPSSLPRARIEKFALPADLQRDFDVLFLAEMESAPGERLIDCHFPVRATLRFTHRGLAEVWSIHEPEPHACGPMLASGPLGSAVNFATWGARMWILRLTAIGWARHVARDAAPYANRIFDGFVDPAYARFTPLARTLFAGEAADEQAEYARVIAHLRALGRAPVPNEDLIVRLDEALRDPAVQSVADLVALLGTGQRTIQRLCQRHFGFTPKVLLRQQRFLRTLTHFSLGTPAKWIGAIDAVYHDQSQFVREFHEFMGMTPSEYAELGKPFTDDVLRATRQDRPTATRQPPR